MHDVRRAPAAAAGWRRRLGRLFPAVEPPARSLRACTLAVVSVLTGGALVLSRQSGIAAVDTLYAEDGWVFLADARRLPFLDAVVEPYAGYAHALPRVVTEPIAALAPGSYAAAMALAGALGASAVALLVFRALAGHLRSVPLRAIAAASVVCVPAGQPEVFASVTNLHWFLAPAAVIVLLWNPVSRPETALAVTFLALAAASDPMVAALAPLALARVAAPLRWQAKLPVAGLAVGLALQAAVIAAGTGTRAPLDPMTNPVRMAAWLAVDVPGRAIAGSVWARDPRDGATWVAVAVAVAVLVALATACWRRLDRASLAVPAVLVAASVLLYVAYAGTGGFRPPRYGVPSAVLLLVACAIAADRIRDRLPAPGVRRLGAAAALTMAAVWSMNWRVDNTRSDGPSWSVELAQAQARCLEGSRRGVETIDLAPHPPFTIDLRCAELAEG